MKYIPEEPAIRWDKNKGLFSGSRGGWSDTHYFDVFNVLFRIENALRLFLFVVLKDRYHTNWAKVSPERLGPGQDSRDDRTESNNSNVSIEAIAKERIFQATKYGYFGRYDSCPLLYLTFGEMFRIITSDKHWELFSRYFPMGPTAAREKFEEIGFLRNAFAHFRPIKESDLPDLKRTSCQLFGGIESLLADIVNKGKVVPPNTTERWLREVSCIGRFAGDVTVHQSNDRRWTGIDLNLPAYLLELQVPEEFDYDEGFNTVVANVDPRAILERCTYLRQYVVAVMDFSDRDGSTLFDAGAQTPEVPRSVRLVFGTGNLKKGADKIVGELNEIFDKIEKERELFTQEPNAEATILRREYAESRAQETPEFFSIEPGTMLEVLNYQLLVDREPGDRPEYWGNARFPYSNIIASTDEYPWLKPVDYSIYMIDWSDLD